MQSLVKPNDLRGYVMTGDDGSEAVVDVLHY